MSQTMNQIEADITQNKIKEGFLLKRSRVLKEWKERWMVLTKTHLYSFVQRGVYKKPTETVSLISIQTMKSYYKQQYEKPWIFRIQSPDVNIYLSAKCEQEKWSWMTAIQKMTDRVCSKDNKPDTYNHIRQTIKMCTAYRESLNSSRMSMLNFQNEQTKNKEVEKISKDLNLLIKSSIIDVVIPPKTKEIVTVKQKVLNEDQVQKWLQKHPNTTEQLNESDFSFSLERSNTKDSNMQKIRQKFEKGMLDENHLQFSSPILTDDLAIPIKSTQKIPICIPTRIVEKIIQKERIVYIPEVRQKIVEVEKIVYLNESSSPLPFRQSGRMSTLKPNIGVPIKLSLLLNSLLSVKCQNIKPIVNLAAFILTQKYYQYHPEVLEFFLRSPDQRYFSQMLLLYLNEQTDQATFNMYIRCITHIYEITQEYFFCSDVKIMVDILLRELAMNKSDLNQFLIMNLFRVLSDKIWWRKCEYRKRELLQTVRLLEAMGKADNQLLAAELMSRI